MGRKGKQKRKDRGGKSGRQPEAPAEEAQAAPFLGDGERPDGPGKFQLEALVLVAGAVLMGLEIVGSRVLAPHFGNSVFVWGSLISVFLTSLAGGYFAGGRLADKYPSWVLINVVLIGSALLILLVPFLAHPLCRWMLSAGWDDRSGPLVASVILFFPPSVLIGMVSPFSVRLATRAVHSVGRTAGGLYALSTVGSIAGTLITTFLLIPVLGVTWILKALGGTLLVFPSLLLLLRLRGLPAVVVGCMVGLIALTNAPAPAWEMPEYYSVVMDEDTPYHHITVVDDKTANVRMLRFDQFVESSIRLEEPYESQAKYTDYFHLAFLLRPQIESAAFIGAGGGIGPRTYRHVNPDMVVDVVDVDQRILDVAIEHFHMPDGEGIHPIAADGRVFLHQTERSYDALILDAFTIGGRIPFHMTTKEYFELCRESLNEGGVFVMNINSALEGADSEIFMAVGATLKQVFPQLYVFAKDLSGWRSDPTDSRNIILVASMSEEPLDADGWRARVIDYPGTPTIDRYRMGKLVEDLVWPTPDLSEGVPFTDDFAPIETMRF
jgi:spermidine synthase